MPDDTEIQKLRQEVQELQQQLNQTRQTRRNWFVPKPGKTEWRWIPPSLVFTSGIIHFIKPNPDFASIWLLLMFIAALMFIYYLIGYLFPHFLSSTQQSDNIASPGKRIDQPVYLKISIVCLFLICCASLVALLRNYVNVRSFHTVRNPYASQIGKHNVGYTKDGIETFIQEIVNPFSMTIPDDKNWQNKLFSPLDRRQLQLEDFLFISEFLDGDSSGKVTIENNCVKVFVENYTSKHQFYITQRKLTPSN